MITTHVRHPSRKVSRLARRRFRAEVLRALRSRPKMLPCKYFYDEAGSELFEQITSLDEYYPTRTELAIMERHAPEMAEVVGRRCLLIEYGSGNSTKTRLLLDQLREPAAYAPIDISGTYLRRSAAVLKEQYPNLTVLPICADFTRPETLPVPLVVGSRRVVYFPGSTIGNLTPEAAVVLLRRTADLVGRHGGLLLGADLRKDAHVLEAAYNDKKGITAAFNRNILVRINRELGADFAADQFTHRAFYNAIDGRIEMHLVSDRRQRVSIGSAEFFFAAGESICTEYSYKYRMEDLHALSTAAGFALERVWTDQSHYFSVIFLTVTGNLGGMRKLARSLRFDCP